MTELPNQQTPYPFVLALSVALFLHVTLATLVDAWLHLPAPNEPAPVVSVRIAPPGGSEGTTPSQPTTPSRPKEQEAATPDADATTVGQTNRTSEPGSASTSETTSPEKNRTMEQTPETPPAAESTSAVGDDSPVSSQDADTPVTRLSRDDRQQRSDYEIQLWEQVAKALEYTPLLTELDRPREIVLELRLMGNGALRRARVGTSSGSPELDGVAREAALAATPFPQPPEGRRRFRVRLIFEPARRE